MVSRLFLPLAIIAFWDVSLARSISIESFRKREGISPAFMNAFDHSWIREWAALGDSYSSGVGAGKALDGPCSRYDAAYPSLINDDESLGADERIFNNYACIGHTTSDIAEKQVTQLHTKQDMITLTAGGNDIFFASLVDACVFTRIRTDCDYWTKKAKEALDSDALTSGLGVLIRAVQSKLISDKSRVFWLLYTPVFEISDQMCDKVSWGRLKTRYLTTERRSSLNDLVSQLNSKIRTAAKGAGKQVVVVDWEAGVNLYNGKICHSGVDETSGKGDDRESLVFYEQYSSLDDRIFGNSQASAMSVSELSLYQVNGTKKFEAIMKNGTSIQAPYANKTEEIRPPNKINEARGIVSDKIKRIFHPQSNGHQIMADAVLTALEQEQAKILGDDAATTTLLGCPAPTGAFSYYGAKSSCNNEEPPENSVTFTRDDAIKQIGDFCSGIYIGQKIDQDRDTIEVNKIYGNPLKVMNLKVSQRTEGDCEELKGFTWTLSDTDCKRNLQSAVDDCDTGTRDKKLGGVWSAQCLDYTVRAYDPSTTRPPEGAGQDPTKCDGNQVEGTCTAGSLPSSLPYSGAQEPSCAKADGKDAAHPRLNEDKTSSAAREYCQQLVDDKIVLEKNADPPNAYIGTGEAENGGDLVISTQWYESSCPEDKSTDKLDFADMGVDKCVETFYGVLEQVCESDSTFPNYSKEWSILGGVYADQCAIWEIAGQETKS